MHSLSYTNARTRSRPLRAGLVLAVLTSILTVVSLSITSAPASATDCYPTVKVVDGKTVTVLVCPLHLDGGESNEGTGTCSPCDPVSSPPPPDPPPTFDKQAFVDLGIYMSALSYRSIYLFKYASTKPVNYSLAPYYFLGSPANNNGRPAYSGNCPSITKAVTFGTQSFNVTLPAYGMWFFDVITIKAASTGFMYYDPTTGTTTFIPDIVAVSRSTTWYTCLYPSTGSVVERDCLISLGPASFVAPVGRNVYIDEPPTNLGSPNQNVRRITWNGQSTWAWDVPTKFTNMWSLNTSSPLSSVLSCPVQQTTAYTKTQFRTWGNYRVKLQKTWRACYYLPASPYYSAQFFKCDPAITSGVVEWWSNHCTTAPTWVNAYRDLNYDPMTCELPLWSCVPVYPNTQVATSPDAAIQTRNYTALVKSELVADGRKWSLVWKPRNSIDIGTGIVSGSVTNKRTFTVLFPGSSPFNWAAIPLDTNMVGTGQPIVATPVLKYPERDPNEVVPTITGTTGWGPSTGQSWPTLLQVYESSTSTKTLTIGQEWWFTAKFKKVSYLFDANGGTYTTLNTTFVDDYYCPSTPMTFVAFQSRNTGSGHTY